MREQAIVAGALHRVIAHVGVGNQVVAKGLVFPAHIGHLLFVQIHFGYFFPNNHAVGIALQHSVVHHGLGFIQSEFELINVSLHTAASIQVVSAELLLQSLHTFIGQIALAGIELLPECAFFNAVFDVQAFAVALRVVRHGPQRDHGDGHDERHLQHQPKGPRVDVKTLNAHRGGMDMGVHGVYLTKIEAVI